MKARSGRLYAQLVRSARERPALAAVFLFCTVTHGVAHGTMALLAGALVRDLALAPMDGRSTAVGGAPAPLALALGGLFFAGLKLASQVGAAHARAVLVAYTVDRIRSSVLEAKLRGMPHEIVRHLGQDDHGAAAELAVGGAARALAALTTHVREVEMGLEGGVLRGVRAFFELVPIVVGLVVVDVRLAACAALVLAPFGALVSVLRRGLKARQVRAIRETEALVAAADDAVTHADLFRVFRAEDRARLALRALAERIAEASRFVTTRAALLSGANEVLGALALVIVVVGAAALRPEDRAALVPFSVVFFLAYRPIRDLSDARLASSKGEAALAAMGVAGAELGASLHATGGDGPPSFAVAPLALEGLVLPHVGVPPLTLAIGAGEVIGIVAPTGSGKTTLFRVLLGLEAAAGGTIRYGAVPLTANDDPGRRPFAWAPQDAPLVAGTVRENVALGAEGTTADAALAAVGAAHLADADIDVLRETRKLSGGERQLVALARAIASTRPVLLLDEPTSGLDAESEKAVLAAIAELRGTRTILFVSHRARSLAVCDRVLDLERGSVREARATS